MIVDGRAVDDGAEDALRGRVESCTGDRAIHVEFGSQHHRLGATRRLCQANERGAPLGIPEERATYRACSAPGRSGAVAAGHSDAEQVTVPRLDRRKGPSNEDRVRPLKLHPRRF
jgi:hypothetical protein